MKETESFEIEIKGENIRLMPDCAVFWKQQSLLCFSDVHLGKAESLQSLGLPIPSGDFLVDLGRIAKLLQQTKAERVLILGDLIHHRRGTTEEILDGLDRFMRFMKNVEFELLLGNHEKGAQKILSRLPMKITEADIPLGPFLFSHGHEAGFDVEAQAAKSLANEAFTIQGHIHPVVVIKQGPTRMRLPCFWMRKNSLTLPSFGSLTGGWEVKANNRDQIFATTHEKIVKIPARSSGH